MMRMGETLPHPFQGERAGERGAERRAASVFAPVILSYSPLSLTSPGSRPGAACPSPPEGGEGLGIVQ